MNEMARQVSNLLIHRHNVLTLRIWGSQRRLWLGPKAALCKFKRANYEQFESLNFIFQEPRPINPRHHLEIGVGVVLQPIFGGLYPGFGRPLALKSHEPAIQILHQVNLVLIIRTPEVEPSKAEVVIGQLDSLHHEPVFEKLSHVITYRERDKGTNERITHANIYKVIAGGLGNLLAKVAYFIK